MIVGPRWSWGYGGGMPKVSVYLPDELYQRARQRGLSLSAVTQQALVQALQSEANAEWVARARDRARRHADEPSVDMTALMGEVRADFGA